MNKRLLKPILTSGLLALAFGAIGTGATFALFTSEAETDIVIGAGKVAMTFTPSGTLGTPSGLQTYSVEANPSGDRTDERGGKYISKLTAVQGTFTNGGTAAYADGVFTLDKITPGDRITFKATLANQSNVNIKYRLVYAFVGNDLTDTTLARGLVTKTNLSGDAETYAGLKTFRSSWIPLAANAAPEKTDYSFDIELPVDKGNEFQQKSARFTMYAEAVQGNADVGDEPLLELFEEDIHNPTPVPVVADTPTIVEAQNKDEDFKVKTTIPANTKDVDAGTTVDLVVSKMIVGEDPKEKTTTLNFDISLYVNNVKTTHFDNSVAVEITVGKYLKITEVKHGNTTLAPADYSYDSAEGIIRFSTQDFSPFSVTYERQADYPGYGFKNSYVENGHWVHVVSTKAHFKNILTHISTISTRSDKSAADTWHGGKVAYPLADETTVYVLANDIDCGGAMWTAEESVLYNVQFTGTFDGADHTISNIHMTLANGSATIRGGLFSTATKAVFQNLTLSDMSIVDAETECPHGFLGEGPANITDGSRIGSYLTFKNITVTSDCYIQGRKNCGSIFGYARSIQTITLENCVNYANISVGGADGYVAGGFIGSASSDLSKKTSGEDADKRYFNIINCQNHGDITGTGSYGGIAGAIGNIVNNNPTYVTINGFLNAGNLKDESSNAVGPVITSQSPHSISGSGYHYNITANSVDNSGFITKQDANATDYAWGLFNKDTSASPVLSNGKAVNSAQFFASHVIASGVVAFSASASQLNTAFDANNKLSLNLSGLSASVWAEATKIIVYTKLTWAASVSYATNIGAGTSAGHYGVHEEEIAISDHAVTTYDVTRLCYAGHTYPAGKNPEDIHIYYDGNEPQGPTPFQYNHEYFKLEGTDSRRGYGTTASGAYFVLDNDEVVAGSYKLLAETYTCVGYVIEVFKGDEKLAYANLTDFDRGVAPYNKLGKMSQIA